MADVTILLEWPGSVMNNQVTMKSTDTLILDASCRLDGHTAKHWP
jgi:hypothetical protein